MTRVIMTKGLPASGKSTWAKSVIDAPNSNAKRVNKDDLRAMLDNGKHSSAKEKFVLRIRDHIIKEALTDNYNVVIVDDTNLVPYHETHIREMIAGHNTLYGTNHTVEIKDFTDVSVEECIKRDALRANPVGAAVIRGMYNKHLKPTAVQYPYDPSLTSCIILDLDGTLCLLNGRNPYDASTCEQDELNQVVYDIAHSFRHTHNIFCVSGRSDKYRAETERWLSKNLPFYSNLFMRKEKDVRKDSVVKQEILDTEFRGKYNIHFVLDDRNQVVDMWRANGITCLQVAPGDF